MEPHDAVLFLAGVAVGGLVVFSLLSRLPPWPLQEPSQSPRLVNKETWEWTDWKGRKRSITVHREVKEVE